jgi:hypothetical protein
MANEKKLSRSQALAAKILYAALSILRDSGKEMPMRDLMSRVEQEVDLDVDSGLNLPPIPVQTCH